MINFYRCYVDPSSPRCSKLVVNINSQVKATTETNNPISSDIGDIEKHLQQKLRVNETELEDAIDLWREVSVRDQKAGETEINGTERGQILDISDLGAFKLSLDTLNPPSIDLSRFEQQG